MILTYFSYCLTEKHVKVVENVNKVVFKSNKLNNKLNIEIPLTHNALIQRILKTFIAYFNVIVV